MLTDITIGNTAGIVWHLLDKHGILSIDELKEKSYCNETIILLALGWLARESKVMFTEMNGNTFVELRF